MKRVLFPVLGSLLSAAALAQPAGDLARRWSTHAPTQGTQLVDIRLNPGFARQLQAIRAGGYENDGGDWVAFQPWYAPAWRDTSLTWMTPLSPRLGLMWGLSTGERAAKYTVEPGLRLGAVFQTEVSRNADVSFRAMHVLGGRLKEKTCQATYADLSDGAVEVNCRLAAGTMAPSETLKQMLSGRPDNATELRLQLNYRF